jgi:hypothetical protein
MASFAAARGRPALVVTRDRPKDSNATVWISMGRFPRLGTSWKFGGKGWDGQPSHHVIAASRRAPCAAHLPGGGCRTRQAR